MITTWKLTSRATVCGVLVSQMRSFLQNFWRCLPRWLHRTPTATPCPWLRALCCFTGGTTGRLLPLLARKLFTPSLLLRSLVSTTRGSCLLLMTLPPPLAGGPIGGGSPRATAFIVRTPRPLLAWGGRFLVWAKLLPREFLQDFTTPETYFWLA